MYFLIFLVPILLAGFLIFRGIQKKRKFPFISGILLFAVSIFSLPLMDFWGWKLWFDSLGFIDRFWTEILAKITTGSIFFLIGALFMYLFTLSIKNIDRKIRTLLTGFTAVLTALIGTGLWEPALQWLNRVPMGIRDPLLGIDASFYMFVLPFVQGIYRVFITLSILTTAVGIFALTPQGLAVLRRKSMEEIAETKDNRARPLILGSILLLLVLSLGLLIDRYQLLYNHGGVVSGPGWTDTYIRLPALIASSIIGVIGALSLIVPPLRTLAGKLFSRVPKRLLPSDALPVAGVYGLVLLSWVLILGFVPWLLQTLLVAPNEITYERPFIEYNIDYTQHGYRLKDIQEEDFSMERTALNPSIVENNQAAINNTRLWDWRALESVYEQFQEIRLYYKFGDIDLDRYTINGEKRAVMVSAREMETENLPEQSQNFVNKRFKYTHGYGIVMNTVNEFTESGLPHLLIKDIPPVSEVSELAVTRPEIYYGERTNSYVIVNSSEEEFDYPEGDNNQYVSYSGSGGVQIDSFFRKFLFGYMFGGTNLLFSNYPDNESRIMFNRNIRERVAKAAPFLSLDHDPYIVLVDGELRWFIDAYTTSSSFPYSEGFSGNGREAAVDISNISHDVNYIRNSVKAVVNPYNGNIDLYMYDENDPIIQVWSKIYPDLLKKKSEMPQALKEHVRYPADFLLMQGEIYAKYHMTDPDVFYNQEDLWVRATEKYYSDIQPVEPYYVIWERPGSNKPEFIIMQPYTPKNKQVLIGWIAGMSDPENYGEFIAYKFPKEERVLGPQQVETKIDQDSFLSGQLSLWDQRGSNVIRGNMLALPLGGTLLYVEPIYLQSETAAYPELRMVALMHNDRLSYAETLGEALQGLYADSTTGSPSSGQQSIATESQIGNLIQRADEAFTAYTKAAGEGDFAQAGQSLDELKTIIDELSN